MHHSPRVHFSMRFLREIGGAKKRPHQFFHCFCNIRKEKDMVDLLRLPTELIWLVLDLATPATKVQALYALGWFNHFWPAVFSMRMKDMIEFGQAVQCDQEMSKKQARFYMCVIRNWSYRTMSRFGGMFYDGHGIAAYDVHPRLLEMWVLYHKQRDRGKLRLEAACSGHIANYKRLMELIPQHIMEDVDIVFWAGNETLARYLLAMKPALTESQVSMAIRKLPLSLLQEMYEAYGNHFDSDRARYIAAISCRIEVLEWLRTKIDGWIKPGMLAITANSRCTRQLLHWYAKHDPTFQERDSVFDLDVSEDLIIRRILIRESQSDDRRWRRFFASYLTKPLGYGAVTVPDYVKEQEEQIIARCT